MGVVRGGGGAASIPHACKMKSAGVLSGFRLLRVVYVLSQALKVVRRPDRTLSSFSLPLQVYQCEASPLDERPAAHN